MPSFIPTWKRTTTDKPLKAALAHASRGWRVLPLHSPQQDGSCSCRRVGCATPFKHPRIKSWPEQATSDAEQLRKWWGMWPDANPAIATGSASGFWVLDIDPRHGGDETLMQLEQAHGALPMTVESITAGGGRHLFFLLPEFPVRNIQRTDGSESPLGAGLDLRGDGGLIVAPGARSLNGRGWHWDAERHPDTTATAAAPEWLLALVRRAVGAGPRAPGAVTVPEKIPHGRQHNTLVSLAGSMRNRGMEPDEIEAALWVVNEKRCEKPGTKEAIKQIAQSMVRYKPAVEEREPPPGRTDASEAQPPAAEPIEVPAPLKNGEHPAEPARAKGKGERLIPAPRTISAAELLRMEIPPQRWAVPEMLPEGISILAGKPKKGKSWLALQTVLAIASGGRALGKIRVEQGEALYLALEDGPRRLKSRLAFLLEGQPPPEDLTLVTAGGWDRMDVNGKIQLDRWLSEHKRARLAVIDTLGRFRPPAKPHGNVYDDEYQVMSVLKGIADTAGCPMLVIHHLRKMAADDPFDTISGSLGLTAAADAVLILERVRGKEEGRLHVTGRDVEDRELALQWEAHSGWTLLGDAAEFERTKEQGQVMEALRSIGRPGSPAEVAKAIGIPRGTAKLRMWRMAEAGLLLTDNGFYSLSVRAGEGNWCNRVTGGEDDPFLSTN